MGDREGVLGNIAQLALVRQETSGPYRNFFPVSNQLSSGCERPPGTARSEGEGAACPGRVGQVLGGKLGLNPLLPFRAIQANGGFWVILVAKGSR